ncbi:transposase [Jeotgalibacillus terrae]|uniref:Transposase n=1 Tax=Jeotgalibacillus terrae TaxID=587735 RepID=A0ABW5ZG05_9BACL|nr:transposase [Jeotgalibacillus terrae]MBM7577812.1 REP element-mobilizing transposase RayT [Jeotgalibacillus terrae]
MPREGRKISSTGIYHIDTLGINSQLLFYDDADREMFLNKLLKIKKDKKFKVYAWCLMDNHYHLVIKESDYSISRIMQSLNGSYARYFNQKYRGSGSIYAGRFYSSPIENISYLHTAIRYIHQNCVRSFMVEVPAHYFWSSCQEYYDQRSAYKDLSDCQDILALFSRDPMKAVSYFIEFTEAVYELPQRKSPYRIKRSDTEAIDLIKSHVGSIELPDIKKLPMNEKIIIIQHLKTIKDISGPQLSRILGIPLGVIWRAGKRED